MRRPGYPRDPATRVNGVAGVTGYPARMLSSASRPFPSRGPLFLTSPYLSHLVFLSSPCGVESVITLPPSNERHETEFGVVFAIVRVLEDTVTKRGSRWITLERRCGKDSCECIEVCSSSDVRLD